jgi:exopolyphosphatase / guanosine-5'-triphosphate,3'-diphosphate pyrophosphatase
VVEVRSASDWTVLAEERAMTRLAHNISSKRLCAESMARSVEAISRFAAHARALGAADVRAYATAAVREAANRDDFISLVHDRAGLRLALVSPRDEGALTHRSASRVFDLTSGTAAVVDIGGGSLEVVQSRRGVITANTSMPLGAVRLTEAFATADAVTPDEFKALRKHIRGQIRRHIRRPEAPPDILVGCGGAFTTLLTLAAADRGVLIDRNSPALASLGPVSRDQLAAILARLASMPLQQRLRVPGLPADRADIIVAGLAVIHRLMKRLGARAVHVHPGGFREGLMLRLIDEHAARLASNGADVSDARRMESVTALARRCEFPRSHTLHVAGLALSLHDHLAGLGLIHPTPDDRLILHAAAILHDVGVMVEYPRHHKHSRTIIRHAPLVGFTDRQVELIALVARYHRRAQPRARHRDFSALADPDQRVVRRLAGILRLADGLDRRHLQTTTAITVEVGRDRITVIAHAPADATEDLIAARKKSPLLARVLGRRVRVAFAGPGATPPSGPVPPPAH